MILVYIYILVFTICFISLAFASLIKDKKKARSYAKENNICVVIYSHNNVRHLESLIKQLKAQTYPKKNYSLNVILDNCSDQSEMLLEGDLEVNALNIKNVDTIGKDQAISIMTERLSNEHNIDAYVFLDAKYFVNSDFLENINLSLQKNNVITGSVNLICKDRMSFMESIKYNYNQYNNNFIQKTRAKLGLTTLVNSDILIIKKQIVDAIGSVNFKNIDEELKFTMLLANLDCKCTFDNLIKVYLEMDNYEIRIPSLSKRISIFCKAIKQINYKNKALSEFIFSMIAPNGLTLILGNLFFIAYSFKYHFNVNMYAVIAIFALLAISFCISLLNTKIYSKGHLYLFTYPVYSLFKVIYNFPPLRFIRRILFNQEKSRSIEKLMVNAWVSNGRRYYPCKLEIISDSGLVKAVFINKKKKYTTKAPHLRVIDAINEITSKLEEYGMTLRICQHCKYFESEKDGSTNMVKGFCKCNFSNRVPGDILPTVLWNSCEAFEKENVVNLLDAISKK